MKKFLLALIILTMQLSAISVSAEGYELDSTLNPDYISYINRVTLMSDEGDGDYRPPVLSYSSPAMLTTIDLPASYDARSAGRIHYSGVGQGLDGVCWAFAATLAAETAVSSSTDLSEQHVKYSESYTGNNPYGYVRTPNGGGNFKMYEAYGSTWRGLVKEEDDPYIYGETTRDYATDVALKPVSYHLQNTVDIPNPEDTVATVTSSERSAHVQEVKSYVYTYGCCFTSMYWSNTYFNSSTNSYYNPSNTTISNHAVAIVGWDDNYSKSNFSTQPQNNGAFIIKNSQGDTGYYMYMSYEDLYAGWDASAVATVEDQYNYGNVYTWDYFEPGAAFNITTGKEAKTTNVYTSEYNGENISAVGVYTKSRNMNYRIYASTTANGNETNESKYSLLTTGSLSMPGFNTIKLPSPFVLGAKGTKYCVRVVYSSDSNYAVPIEYPIAGSIENISATAGQSYFGTGSATQVDIGTTYGGHVFVKAYTDADYTLTFPFMDNSGASVVKYSLNGGSEKALTKTLIAGLNDRITINFGTFSANSISYEGNNYDVVNNKVSFSVTSTGTVADTNPLSYTVSFNAAGGTGAPSPISGNSGTDGTIPSAIPEKLGYSFKGWTDGTKVYNAGDTVKFTSNMTLTAIWEQKPPATANLSFKYYNPDGTEASKIFKGNVYEIAVVFDSISDLHFFGAQLTMHFNPIVMQPVGSNGNVTENVNDVIISNVESPNGLIRIAEGCSLNKTSGLLNYTIAPALNSPMISAGYMVPNTFELVRFRMRAIENGNTEIHLATTETGIYNPSNPLGINSKFGSLDTTSNITEQKQAKTVGTEQITCNSYTKGQNKLTFSFDVNFGGNQTVIVALYKNNTLVGLKTVDCNDETTSFMLDTPYSQTPDTIKIMVWDSLSKMTTYFSKMETAFS